MARDIRYRNIKYMSQFCNNFSLDEIRQQPVAQISLGTIINIMSKSKSHEEMLWYINQTHKNGWIRSMVLNQISMKFQNDCVFLLEFSSTY